MEIAAKRNYFLILKYLQINEQTNADKIVVAIIFLCNGTEIFQKKKVLCFHIITL